MEIRAILCPTDFSAPADRALAAAEDLARRFGATLLLAHVVEPMPAAPAPHVGASPAFDIADYLAAMREHGERELEARVSALCARGLGARWRLAEGPVADMIIDLAAAADCDLIVIATHGRTGLKRFFLGSVADKVVHHATCPVLTIKEPK